VNLTIYKHWPSERTDSDIVSEDHAGEDDVGASAEVEQGHQ
jgi:hypothetical protein